MPVDWDYVRQELNSALHHLDLALEEMGDEVEHIASGLREHKEGVLRHYYLAESKAGEE